MFICYQSCNWTGTVWLNIPRSCTCIGEFRYRPEWVLQDNGVAADEFDVASWSQAQVSQRSRVVRLCQLSYHLAIHSTAQSTTDFTAVQAVWPAGIMVRSLYL